MIVFQSRSPESYAGRVWVETHGNCSKRNIFFGKGGIRSWVQMSDGTEVDSPKVNVLVGQSRKISNYAYERYAKYGKVYVRLAIEANYFNFAQVEAGGVWSPDSV